MMQWVSLDGITRRIINVEFDNVIKSKCFESYMLDIFGLKNDKFIFLYL